MSYDITPTAKAILDSKVLTPLIIVRVEGYGDILTSATITEVARYGSPGLVYGMPGLVYGGVTEVANQEDLISLDGTTSQITQQLLQDEGASSSTTNMTIALVNKDNVFASLITPVGNDDIISKKAEVFLGAQGMNYPEDFIRIFVGNVTQVSTPAGLVKIQISHPEGAKRDELFTQIQTELNGSITNSQTTITVDTTAGMLLPGDLLETYVQIDDEVIRYTGLTATTLTGCTRGQLGTTAAAHSDEAEVSTFYVLGDDTADSNAILLALKVLISGNQDWISENASTFSIDGTILVPGIKLITEKNLQIGDSISITGASEVGNNLTNELILDIEETFAGTIITVGASLTLEADSAAVLTASSQYDTLPEGVGLTPDQVDISEFNRIFDLFSSSIPNYRFYLKESISGKDLVNKQILFPAACYSIPRKGQVSVGKTKPPIAEFETKIIDENTVLNASSLSIERSSLENFYNAIIYQFEESVLDDKLRTARVTLSANSTNRIKVGTKAYRIEARGLRKSTDTEVIIENNATRLLDRYQYGADKIKGVKVPFSVGWNIEVGDTLVVQGLQLFDTKTGERTLDPRIMEVSNRSFNFRSGVIELDLIDTAFAIDGRYGVVSPSSNVVAGSTTTNVVIERSFGTTSLLAERYKWESFIGSKILIHSEDWTTYSEVTTLTGFSASNDNVMIVAALPTPPPAGCIVDIPTYEDAEPIHKASHCYFDPQDLITANATLQNEIEVATPSIFFVGSIIKVHSPTYSSQSIETVITNISGSTLTLRDDLGYLPQIDDEIELVGFNFDDGLPYRIL